MSLCPTKDIHSVYLDNEMPLSYIKEYEAHVQNCPKCSAELNRMKAVRNLLTSGSNDDLSKEEMDESFKRLQMKMRFTQNTKSVKTTENRPLLKTVKYVIPAMAAAAVFAVVLPLGLKGKNNSSASQQIATVAPISANTVAFPPERAANLSGNIPNSVVATGRTVNTREASNIDVFRPNFDNENTITIKITVPGMNAVPYTTEKEFPVEMYKGNSGE